ncbi:hypothetical protein J2T08_002952 [Neorhizobium galegae]|uniref:hypothetical protein n=1 Tax=Neorhizobium galegae TaxID=399 RepID=UPI0027887631|nr:hypothetical protein [Neorhizobium galegae]MDQ0135031.1 hypothetical protein [Neorhizobium galegae]
MNIDRNFEKSKSISLPYNTFTWINAIQASDARTKARALSLAIALFRLADIGTCRTWAGVATLMQESRILDRDNFNKARRDLESIGALHVHPIHTLPEVDRLKALAKDPRGKWYQLDIEWAILVLANEEKTRSNQPCQNVADSAPHKVDSTLRTRSNRPDEQGQNDLENKVKTTPLISKGSPIDLLDDLLDTVVPCSTADDALRASPLRSESSSLRWEASAYVVDPPPTEGENVQMKEGEVDPDDVPIPLPHLYDERSKFVKAITGGRNSDALGLILAKWQEDRFITRRTAQSIFEDCEARRKVS